METGIAPKEFVEMSPEMLAAIYRVLKDRNEAAKVGYSKNRRTR